jgi:hypothetical protein
LAVGLLAVFDVGLTAALPKFRVEGGGFRV